MREFWHHSKFKHLDKKGQQWHFVTCDYMSDEIEYKDSPIEFYFRNDDRTYYGMLRIEKRKDNPYRFEKLVEKVMANEGFRGKCYAPSTEDIWSRSWK